MKEGSRGKRDFNNTNPKVGIHIYLIVNFLFLLLLVSCSVENRKPYVVSISIEDGKRFSNPKDIEEITIVFSDKMNRYVTERNIVLAGYYDGFICSWSDSGKTCTMKLKEHLEKGNEYTLEIKSGCENIDGYDIGADTVIRFYTFLLDDDFFVVSTSPSDGEVIEKCDNLSIRITFSLPVDYVSVYNSVSIEPALNYLYSFSEDREILSLYVVQQVDCGEVYTITLSDEINAIDGHSLGEEYSFSFSTVDSQESFIILSSSMKNPYDETTVVLDTAYLSNTNGIEKNWDLVVEFSSEFFLSEASKMISIEPAIDYHLEKNGNKLIVYFLEEMTPEEEYWIDISGEFENTYGQALEVDYRFGWVVSGQDSVRPRVENCIMVNPDGGDDVVIFLDGEVIHNRAMPLSYKLDYVEVEFGVEFSKNIDLYRVLDSVSLDFQFGNANATTGELVGYSLDSSGKWVSLVFSLPDISSGGDGYYKFIIRGGEDGVVDLNNNSLKEDIEIYVIYDID